MPDHDESEQHENKGLKKLNDAVAKVLGPADIESVDEGPQPDSRSEKEYADDHGVEIKEDGGHKYAVSKEENEDQG